MSAKRIDLVFEPVDTWFFRDARPMQAGAGSGGHGARWPFPVTVYAALRTALLDAVGELPGEKTVTVRRRRGNGAIEAQVGSTRFDHLRLRGGLPRLGERLYFPTPLDLVVGDGGKAGPGLCSVRNPVRIPPGRSNLPAAWLHPVGAYVPPSKESLPQWIPQEFLQTYLNGDGAPWPVPAPPDLWTSEHRFGIQIDPETRTVVEGAFYTAEHLRLAEGAGLWASLEVAEEPELEGLLQVWNRHGLVALGGEGRLARVRRVTAPELPVAPVKGERVKWVLATPAVFQGGWRPGWVDPDSGRVRLRPLPQRQPGESRGAWRRRMQESPEIAARLVAVCSDKPVGFSGWEVLGGDGAGSGGGAGAPRSTRRAVPAGSVYYFEADNEEAARALVTALHNRCHSDELGEKGLGWGFCGTWEWLEPFWEPET